MAQDKEKIAMIVNTASYERVAFALGIAATQQALGKEVHVLFGYGGLIRLKKGFTDQVGEETDHWVREQVKSGIEKGSISKISELLQDLSKLGGKIYACPAAMTLHGIPKDELIEEVYAVRGVTAFLQEQAKDASKIIYV